MWLQANEHTHTCTRQVEQTVAKLNIFASPDLMTISDRIAWQREEALATIVDLEMLDLPAGQSESTENFVTLTKSEGNPLRLAMLRLQIQVMLAKVY